MAASLNADTLAASKERRAATETVENYLKAVYLLSREAATGEAGMEGGRDAGGRDDGNGDDDDQAPRGGEAGEY